jgi:hypothetical protein
MGLQVVLSFKCIDDVGRAVVGSLVAAMSVEHSEDRVGGASFKVLFH